MAHSCENAVNANGEDFMNGGFFAVVAAGSASTGAMPLKAIRH
jgi:hypothetical protein